MPIFSLYLWDICNMKNHNTIKNPANSCPNDDEPESDLSLVYFAFKN